MVDVDPLWSGQETQGRQGMRDGRLHYRILTRSLGITVVLRGQAAAALPGQLLDLSAGGCSLAAPSGLDLRPGNSCTVDLPVTYRDQLTVTPYPAMVVSVEPNGQTAVVLRLRFRPRSFKPQQQLLSWLRSLHVQVWHAASWRDGGPATLADALRVRADPDRADVDRGVQPHEGGGRVAALAKHHADPARDGASEARLMLVTPAEYDAALAAVLGLLSAEEQRALLAQVAETLELAGHADDAALLRVVLRT